MASPVGSPSPSHTQAASSESSPRTPASAHLKPLRPAFRRANTAPDRVPSSSLSPLSMSNEHSPFDPPRMSTMPSNATGTKTPKKVSWAADTSGDTPLVHHGSGMNARDIRQLHHLDEQGLDVSVHCATSFHSLFSTLHSAKSKTAPKTRIVAVTRVWVTCRHFHLRRSVMIRAKRINTVLRLCLPSSLLEPPLGVFIG